MAPTPGPRLVGRLCGTSRNGSTAPNLGRQHLLPVSVLIRERHWCTFTVLKRLGVWVRHAGPTHPGQTFMHTDCSPNAGHTLPATTSGVLRFPGWERWSMAFRSVVVGRVGVWQGDAGSAWPRAMTILHSQSVDVGVRVSGLQGPSPPVANNLLVCHAQPMVWWTGHILGGLVWAFGVGG